MRRCPKCGYVRQPEDDEIYGQDECPKCGTIYIKYQAYLAQKQEEEQAKTRPPKEVQAETESVSQKTCSKCGESFDPHLFGVLPWNCPTCNGRYWDQQTTRKQNVCLYALLAILLVVVIGIGTLSILSAHKRREAAQREQAEKLKIQREQEAERIRAREQQAARLKAQGEQEAERVRALQEQEEMNKLIKTESLAAYNALKQIHAMMLSGSTLGNYSKAVEDARRELDMLRPYLDQSKDLELIFGLYQEAKHLWQTKTSGNVLTLCEEYRRIITEKEFSADPTSKDECLKTCESLSATADRAKREEVYKTVKPYVEELLRQLWSEAAISMEAFEQRWGFP
jgi:predicted  nucleic acid-binding Zn-ribbon protein